LTSASSLLGTNGTKRNIEYGAIVHELNRLIDRG